MDADVAQYELKMHPVNRVFTYIVGSSAYKKVLKLGEELLPEVMTTQYHLGVQMVFRLMVRGAALDAHNDEFASSHVGNVLEATGGDLGFRELDKKGREQRSKKQAFIQRIIMAMFGGLALIGPMLIMTLHPSRNTSLITVSIATFLFALALAFIAKDSSGKDVLGATAAYAAVLVVFVGTSMAPAVSG